jgi:hypothetical protein
VAPSAEMLAIAEDAGVVGSHSSSLFESPLGTPETLDERLPFAGRCSEWSRLFGPLQKVSGSARSINSSESAIWHP